MQEATTKGIYDFMSSIYDKTFSPLVKRRIQTAIGHMVIGQNDWVLDMGIGTRQFPELSSPPTGGTLSALTSREGCSITVGVG